MKSFVAFFLSLFLLLLLGAGFVQAESYKHTHYPSGLQLKKSNPYTENSASINADSEDEDSQYNNRSIAATRYFIALAYLSLFIHLFHSKVKLPFCSHFPYYSSYKYILQRVLRI